MHPSTRFDIDKGKSSLLREIVYRVFSRRRRSGDLEWRELTPVEWRDQDNRRAEELRATGISHPYEKEYLRKDGSRVPVLVGAALFEERGDEGVAFVIDLTDRKKAEEVERRYMQVKTELAHANRLAAMGQLSASIVHEINQPIGSAITYANAASSWLHAQPPNLEEVQQALGFIVESGVRAGEVIDRIRALVKKAPPLKALLNVNEAIFRGHRADSRRIGKEWHFRKDATCG